MVTGGLLWDQNNPPSLFFFFFPNSLSLHLWFLTSPLWPTSMSVDRDRHMQGGQQPCLASPSGPWQKISMGTDNGTSNENNTVCQPRNSACHSGPFPMLEVFHELWWTRELNLEFNSLLLHQLNTGCHSHMWILVIAVLEYMNFIGHYINSLMKQLFLNITFVCNSFNTAIWNFYIKKVC